MEGSVGNFFLSLAVLLSFYSLAVGFAGLRTHVHFLKKSALVSFYLQSAAVVLSSAMLLAAFVFDRFELSYVFSYSAASQSLLYKAAGFYAGREGSLLMWALMLSIASSIYLFILARRKDSFLYENLLVFSLIELFFVALIYFKSSPFEMLDFVPKDGRGLNPLLENYWMIFHPPALYLGFIIFTIPFSQAVVSLMKKDFDGSWAEKTRVWIILSWLLLGIGNVLGSYWAYIELGWGGYWAWDPVENASLIPWLISTALVHSVVAERRVKTFRRFNYALIFATFISTIVATFLTRSGIVSSVHAFAKSEVADFFLAFIIFLIVSAYGMLIYRSRKIPESGAVDSMTSRESSFAILGILFLASGLAVLVGTLMPVISELLISRKITLEAPYYNRVFSLIGVVILFGLGVAPLFRWKNPFKGFTGIGFPGYILFSVGGAIVSVFLGERSPLSVISYGLCLGAFFSTLYAIFSGLKGKFSAKELLRQGGMLVHVGIILMAFGMTGTAEKVEVETKISKGEGYAFEGYKVVSEGFTYSEDKRKEMVFAKFDLYKNEKKVASLDPAKFFYKPTFQGMEPQVTTEMGVFTTVKEDILVILLAFDLDNNIFSIKLVRNPLIVWLWIGSAVMFIGTVFVIFQNAWERKRREDED